MLLHIDGSQHGWFQNSQRYDLMVSAPLVISAPETRPH